MFSKIKKFFLMFAFCMSIFGITAFADTISVEEYALGLDGMKYYLTYTGKVSGTVYLYTYDSVSFDIDSSYSNSIVCLKGASQYKKVGDSWVLQTTNVDTYVNTVLVNFSTNNYDVYYAVVNSGMYEGDLISPPLIAPTAREAIAKIIPDLSKQLKILLPVGVIILSTMLGVSLVRRLVPLFL